MAASSAAMEAPCPEVEEGASAASPIITIGPCLGGVEAGGLGRG
jgi:hypothetical protein